MIGGDWVDGADGGYEIVNPATEEVVGIAPEASEAQALDAARAAQEAFPAWSQTSPDERANLLQAVADAMRDKFDDLLPLVIAETGCTATVGKQMQVPQARVRFETYSRLAHESNVIPLPPMEMPATALAPGGLMGAIARRQPVGAVARDHAVQLPGREHGGQARARARDGQHRRGAARVAEPARGHRARAHHARGRVPAGRRQRRDRLDSRSPARRSSRRATSTWSRSPVRPASACASARSAAAR